MNNQRWTDMNYGEGMPMPEAKMEGMMPDMNGCCQPVMAPPCERIVTRQCHHVVRHIQPIHTRIINEHIIHHRTEPCFTCSEENVCCNVFDPPCAR